MNRLQLNLALVALVAALAATLYLTQKKEERGPPLTPLAETALERIRIEHPGAPAIALQKLDGTWRLTEPVAAAADALEVTSIVNLATMEAKRKLAVADVKLAELKLDPPQYTVTLNDTQLEFGDSEPIEFRRYVRVGDNIALIDEPSAAALDADYSDLVAKELLPADAEIVKIEVPGLSLARSADGQSWNLTPAQADASADQKQKLVDAWKSARAMWNAAAPADGAASGEAVTITLKDGVVNLLVVAREPQLVIGNPALGVHYTLSKALEAELLQVPAPTPAAEDANAVADAP